MNYVIRLRLPQCKAELTAFDPHAEQREGSADEKELFPARPFFRQQFTAQQANGKEEGHIHEITAKDLLISSIEDRIIGKEGEKRRSRPAL